MSEHEPTRKNAELFAACRAERPNAAVPERVLATLLESASREPKRRVYAAWALLAAGAALVVELHAMRPPTPSIGAERLSPIRPSHTPASVSVEQQHATAVASATSVVSARTAPKAAPVRPLTLEDETKLLAGAQSSLRNAEPHAALQALDSYERSTAHSGALGAEATLLRMETLAALGDATSANRLAASFVAAYPNSPLVDRARRYLVSTGPGGGPDAGANLEIQRE